jgi:hypothetical protein
VIDLQRMGFANVNLVIQKRYMEGRTPQSRLIQARMNTAFMLILSPGMLGLDRIISASAPSQFVI